MSPTKTPQRLLGNKQPFLAVDKCNANRIKLAMLRAI